MNPPRIRPLGPLSAAGDVNPLTAHWLDGAFAPEAGLENATDAVASALARDDDDSAPAWTAPWFSAWSREQLDLQPDADSRDAATRNLELLGGGAARVVITGQQPGVFGGPLYTLYKAATAVALAERRTARGLPTVPLFWCGDDDDDLDEAWGVRVWDPRRAVFLTPKPPAVEPGTMVGGLPLRADGEPAWLAERTGSSGRDLAAVRAAAVAAGDDRGRWQRRLLARLFAGRGLLSVSGNDAGLMDAAAPFLRDRLGDAAASAEIARRRGVELVAAGYHAQIAPASLERPFQSVSDGRRFRCTLDEASAREPAELRPGLMLRSPLQDWLFRPAAVVVGPGEKSYLEQLRPLYAALGLTRAPLVPRLFATLGPSASTEHDTPSVPAAFSSLTEKALASALAEAGDVEAAGTAARLFAAWEPRLRRAFAALAKPARTADDWRRFRGARQERVLPVLWAAALWGAPLIDAVIDAADRHLDAAATGPVADWDLHLNDPETGATS